MKARESYGIPGGMNVYGGLVVGVARPEYPELSPGRWCVVFRDGTEFCLPAIEYTPKVGDRVRIRRRWVYAEDTHEITPIALSVQINQAPPIPFPQQPYWQENVIPICERG